MADSYCTAGDREAGRPHTAVALFCGAGGFSEGFRQAGFRIVAGVDNNPVALLTYAANFPEARALRIDMADDFEANWRQIRDTVGETVDVVIGGPPCQGISLSGPRRISDPRNQLLLAFVKMVSQIRPRAFILENVPGVSGLFKGRYRDLILSAVHETGYAVAVSLLLAADYGVPQLRRRIFFVGLRETPAQFGFPPPTHYPGESMFGANNRRGYATCHDALSDLPSLASDLGSERQDYASAPQNDFQISMREGSLGVFNHIAARHGERVRSIIRLVPPGGNYKALPEHLRDTRRFHVAWTRMHGQLPAPTVDTGHRHHFHYLYDRVPTVREHARLQSFPDRFVFEGNKTQQFAQVGNAVPPLLARALAGSLKECL